MPSLGVVCLGSVERALGLSAAATGLADKAVLHFEAAIRADRRLGSRPMAAVTEHTLASVLRARGGEGDGSRAEQLSRHAEDRAASMGMKLPAPPAWLLAGGFASRGAGRRREASLQSCPGGWRIVTDGRVTLLPDRVGLGYLADLIARPGKDLDVLTLASNGLLSGRCSDPVADGTALESYRRRALELDALIERGSLTPSVSDKYREELRVLQATLRSSTGLGGRKRGFPDDDQRARTAVRKALVRAIAAIESAEADLGHHLQASVATGITCRYSPAPGWNVTAHH